MVWESSDLNARDESLFDFIGSEDQFIWNWRNSLTFVTADRGQGKLHL